MPTSEWEARRSTEPRAGLLVSFGLIWCFGTLLSTHIVAPRTPLSYGVM